MFKNVGVVGSSSAFVLFIIGQTFSGVLWDKQIAMLFLFSKDASNVLIPPKWSKDSINKLLYPGLSFLNLFNIKLKSCKIIFGKPVLPDENIINPDLFFLRKFTKILFNLIFFLFFKIFFF